MESLPSSAWAQLSREQRGEVAAGVTAGFAMQLGERESGALQGWDPGSQVLALLAPQDRLL